MHDPITPISKKSLADNLAEELKKYIIEQGLLSGDKLPATSVLARQFGIGLPTLREGLKKLETVGAIEMKHGSGIYVGEHINSLFLMNPIVSDNVPTRKQLLDLIEARISIEPTTAALAAENARPEQIAAMEQFLLEAKGHFDDNNMLTKKNLLFHREIADASGNSVFCQILTVITNLFRKEQRMLIDIFRSKETDHAQHLEIFQAIKEKNQDKAAQLMRFHLEGVRDAILHWNPAEKLSES